MKIRHVLTVEDRKTLQIPKETHQELRDSCPRHYHLHQWADIVLQAGLKAMEQAKEEVAA